MEAREASRLKEISFGMAHLAEEIDRVTEQFQAIADQKAKLSRRLQSLVEERDLLAQGQLIFPIRSAS